MYIALCHCPLQSKWGCSSNSQISQHALLRCSSMATHSSNYAMELVKLTGWNMYHWEVFSTGSKWLESFIAYMWVILLCFDPESRLISGMLELGQVRLFWKFDLVKNLIAVRELSNLSLKFFFGQLGMKMLKYENKMLILGQHCILCDPDVVKVSVRFLLLTAWVF